MFHIEQPRSRKCCHNPVAEASTLLRRCWCSTTLLGSSGVHALAPVVFLAHALERIWNYLHEGPAEKRDQDHRQPRRHLSHAPSSVSKGNGQVVLLEETVEWVENALVGRNLVNLVVDDKLLEGLGGGRGAVQGLVAELRNGRRLVGQGLGDAELDQRRRADGPRVAEDVLLLAVEETKLRRRGLRGDDRGGCLMGSVL